ncbi:unnamed protein product [Phaedon cochleariae]|uniref:Tudor domain-containing protein n=1 Tax=Phaedon cochleariae TaxID=80249 RepID=A0A9N9SDB5_PHACE|nr:unnamed protein product [Phaedon cochleariae]
MDRFQREDIDWKYIQQHTDKQNYEIPCFYDTQSWNIGETYSMRIGNIYDPSKFWTVFCDRELTIFQEFLNNFYKINSDIYKMPKQSVKRLQYCVAFTDGEYYRGLIVDIPLFGSLDNKLSVFLLDFGFSAVVYSNDIHYLSKNLFEVPQFSVRSCIYGMEPYNTDTWTVDEVKRFSELTTKKRLLCVLENTDPSRKIVYITIHDFDEISRDKPIRDVLISERLAKMTTLENKKNKKVGKSKFAPKIKYPFLFPTFEAIEGAETPSTVYTSELLKSCLTAGIILFKSYYSYNGINLS